MGILLIVCLIAIFQSNHIYASDKPLYFIKTDAYEYGRPDVTIYIDIYKYDEQQNTVTKVWPINDSVEVHDVRMYESAGIIIVSDGKYETKKLKILKINDPTHAITFNLENMGFVSNYKYYYYPESMGQIEVKFMSGTRGNYSYAVKRFDIDSNSDITGDTTKIRGKRRLAGVRRPNRGGDFDIARLSDIQSEALQIHGDDITLDVTPIPEDLVKTESQFGWNLIANELSARQMSTSARAYI